MKYEYLILHPDEDGNPAYFIKDKVALNEWLEEFEEYEGEESKPIILVDWPEEDDPQIWEDNIYLIIKLDSIVVPKIKLSI